MTKEFRYLSTLMVKAVVYQGFDRTIAEAGMVIYPRHWTRVGPHTSLTAEGCGNLCSWWTVARPCYVTPDH